MHMNRATHLWEYQWFRDLVMLLVVAVVVLLAYSLRAVIIPMLVALALAYAFHPLITWLHEKARIPRWLSTTGVLAIVTAVFLSVLLWFAPQLINQTRNLFDRLPAYITYARQELDDLKDWAQEQAQETAPTTQPTTQPATRAARMAGTMSPMSQSVVEIVTQTLEAQPQFKSRDDDDSAKSDGSTSAASQNPPRDAAASDWTASAADDQDESNQAQNSGDRSQAGAEGDAAGDKPRRSNNRQTAINTALNNFDLSTVSSMVAQVFNTGLAVVGVTLSFGMYLALAGALLVLGFFFFSWKFDKILAWGDSFIPAQHRERTMHILRRMDKAISAFVRGRLVQVSIITCVLCTGWAWVGVPYWLLLGIVGGMLNIVPYAAVISWPLAILLMWIDTASGGSVASFTFTQVFLWPSVVYIVAQGLDGWVVEPLVQGKATNLDPFTVLVAVIVGGALLGIMGTIIAVPTAACLKILLQEVILPHVRRQIHDPQRLLEDKVHTGDSSRSD